MTPPERLTAVPERSDIPDTSIPAQYMGFSSFPSRISSGPSLFLSLFSAYPSLHSLFPLPNMSHCWFPDFFCFAQAISDMQGRQRRFEQKCKAFFVKKLNFNLFCELAVLVCARPNGAHLLVCICVSREYRVGSVQQPTR